MFENQISELSLFTLFWPSVQVLSDAAMFIVSSQSLSTEAEEKQAKNKSY